MKTNHSTASFSGISRQLTRGLLACGGLALLVGCASEPEAHVVSAPPPPAPGTVITTTPAQTQTVVVPAQTQTTTVNGQVVATTSAPVVAGTIVVTQAPPTPQQEVVLARPSPDHVWVEGYWTWRDSRYQWVAGHWVVPPYSNAVWVKPRWESRADGTYVFYEGYWR